MKAGRRNLPDDQRAMIADEAAEQESKLVQADKMAKAREVKKSGSMEDAVASIEKPKDRTRAKAAKAAKVSERKMKKARKARHSVAASRRAWTPLRPPSGHPQATW